MPRLLALALILTLSSLQAQAISMNMHKDDTRPLLPLQYTTGKGELVKVEYPKFADSLSKDGTLLQITMQREDGSEKEAFSLLVPPVGAVEIGLLQGWKPQRGDKVHIEAPGFRPIDFGDL